MFLTTRVFQSLIDIPTLKIRSLKVDNEVSRITGVDLLIRRVGLYLEHLEIGIGEETEREKVFESIINSCDKIKLLYLYDIGDKNIPQLFKLITQFNKHLKYLSLQIKYYCAYNIENNLKTSSMILKGLGQILPDSLEYLDLCLTINSKDLKTFLNNCKNVRLDKLLVQNHHCKNVDITFKVLKKFVEKTKVKNFAYHTNVHFNPKNSEHRNLEKLISKIQPFVKMKRYNDLVIKFSDLISFNTR